MAFVINLKLVIRQVYVLLTHFSLKQYAAHPQAIVTSQNLAQGHPQHVQQIHFKQLHSIQGRVKNAPELLLHLYFKQPQKISSVNVHHRGQVVLEPQKQESVITVMVQEHAEHNLKYVQHPHHCAAQEHVSLAFLPLTAMTPIPAR